MSSCTKKINIEYGFGVEEIRICGKPAVVEFKDGVCLCQRHSKRGQFIIREGITIISRHDTLAEATTDFTELELIGMTNITLKKKHRIILSK